MTKDTSRDEDPRKAFLRHNEGAAANPYWTAPVYAKNQPVTLLADVHCGIRLLRGGIPGTVPDKRLSYSTFRTWLPIGGF